MAKLRLTIDGMSCAHCVRSLQTALEAIPGVQIGDVQIGSAVVELTHEDALKDIRSAIEEEGYRLVDLSPMP